MEIDFFFGTEVSFDFGRIMSSTPSISFTFTFPETTFSDNC